MEPLKNHALPPHFQGVLERGGGRFEIVSEKSGGKSLAGAALQSAHPDRCAVCALPMPQEKTGAKPRPTDQSGDAVCSRRCAGRRRESAAVWREKAELVDRILAEVAALAPGTTMCPGGLSHRAMPGVEQPLTVLRPVIFELAEEGRLRLSQKGKVVRWMKIRGPFRVGKA